MPRKKKSEPDPRELMKAEMIRILSDELNRDLNHEELVKVDKAVDDWVVSL